MTERKKIMSAKLETLSQNLAKHLGGSVVQHPVAFGEIMLDVDVVNYLDVMAKLRNRPELAFTQLMDLCGIDYSAYKNTTWSDKRFAVVCHLRSITHNWQLRVRCFANDDNFPTIPSLTFLWSAVNWFEREAFDLFGIVFEGHEDLRRLLTDYGFIGHPFRKDFPLSGYVEMRYDPQQQCLVYEPLSIEPRENTPRIVREQGYGGMKDA